MDVDTREELSALLKENCVLRPLLRDEKPCPKFGPSGTCQDCLYGWEILAQRVLKVIGARRSSYEKEREKVKIATDKADSLEKTVGEVFSLFAKIGDGFASLGKIIELAKSYQDAHPQGKEQGDGESFENRH
ncbi:hypothetical protein E2P64_07545 [Candidatus Bathyarchaeota archaeon]|nr:hypothetical protein E2P64_07545 [Candidatus Bathyarchaeota archaeon]